jgi:hypothetical protein
MGSLMPDGALRRIGGADTLPAGRVDSIRAAQMRVQARRDSMATKLMRETYARPALAPAMTWLDDDPPPAPTVVRRAGVAIGIEPGRGEAPFLWVVQSRWREGWRTEIITAATREWTVGSTLSLPGTPDAIWVSSVDRVGNQSPVVRLP